MALKWLFSLTLFIGAQSVAQCCDDWQFQGHYWSCETTTKTRCLMHQSTQNHYDCCSTDLIVGTCQGFIRQTTEVCPALRTFSSTYFCVREPTKDNRPVHIRMSTQCLNAGNPTLGKEQVTYLCCSQYANQPNRKIERREKLTKKRKKELNQQQRLRLPKSPETPKFTHPEQNKCLVLTYEDEPCKEHNRWIGPKWRHCVGKQTVHFYSRKEKNGPVTDYVDEYCEGYIEQPYPANFEGESLRIIDVQHTEQREKLNRFSVRDATKIVDQPAKENNKGKVGQPKKPPQKVAKIDEILAQAGKQAATEPEPKKEGKRGPKMKEIRNKIVKDLVPELPKEDQKGGIVKERPENSELVDIDNL